MKPLQKKSFKLQLFKNNLPLKKQVPQLCYLDIQLTGHRIR